MTAKAGTVMVEHDQGLTDTATLVPHSRMRQAIIRTVNASNAVPQFAVEVDVAIGPLKAVRRDLANPAISLTDLVHAATVKALAHHPLLNAQWTDGGVLKKHQVHLGFIVEVGDGMLTPVIREAQTLPITDLSTRRRDLTGRALGGLMRPEEMAGATFTVSNLGSFGVRRFTAMVLPGQSAVLAVGTATPDGQLALTVSVDHRVVDGAAAARFASDLRVAIEDPNWMTQAPSIAEQEHTS